MKHFVLKGKSCIFAPLEPAKPLNDAQIGGSFFYYTYMKASFHRLSAYIYPFYKSPKSDLRLKEGTTFEQVLTLYRFDKKLRILLFNEIEKIEVAIRSVLANIGCQELSDKYWITKAEYFANTEKFNQTLAVIEKELASSKEDYIEDFRRNYIESNPPAWMITEVGMDDNRSIVFRQSQLHLLQHCEQQVDETYC